MRESSTLKSQRIVQKRRDAKKPVYNWGLGANPLGAPSNVIEALKDHAHEKAYAPVEGIPELAHTLAKKYRQEGFVTDASNVLVATGLKELLWIAQAAFGGEIIHIAPFWVSYREQAQILGKIPTVIQTDWENGFKLTPDEIYRVCQDLPDRPRMILFNHPVNPNGNAYSPAELEALAEAFEKHRILVFADEVYLGNCHHGDGVSIANFYPQGTVRASSLSKEFGSGGDRLGWAVFPQQLNWLKNAMAAIASSTYSCGPLPQQYAAIAALKGGEIVEDYLEKSRWIFRNLGRRLAAKTQEIGLECLNPEAAWYLMIRFEEWRDTLAARGITTSGQLVERLIEETGIVFVAGSAFGLPDEALYVRGSYIDFSANDALQAYKNRSAMGAEALSACAARMENSLDILGRWLKKSR